MPRKKVFLLCLLAGFVFVLSSCQTTRGITQNVGCTIDNTAKNIDKGAKSLWAKIMKADNWMRENMW